MRRLTLATATLIAVGIVGCDRLPFIGGGDEAATSEEQQAAPADSQPTVDSTAVEAAAVAARPATPPTQPQPPARPVTRTQTTPGADEPWTPTHTGTVEPGMTVEQVVAVWGEPVAERTLTNWTYLYFRNGCEISCGTFDVVMLEGGQVVDAIVRGPGHTYAGVSSSPPGREATFTPPTSG